MSEAADEEHLPHSIGGLIAFALSGWAANALLYAGLAAGMFALTALAEAVLPAAVLTTQLGQFKLYVLLYTELFSGSFVIAAVALGVAARGLGTPLSPGTIAGGATERWLPVIAVTFLSQTVILFTGPLSGLNAPPELGAAAYVAAPLVWILWGILGLTGPFVALARTRAALTVLVGFGNAFTASLRPGNLSRLCVLALIAVLPLVLEVVLEHALEQRHVARSFFWANIPIDALIIGPVSAIQTVFALDFVRRASQAAPPRA